MGRGDDGQITAVPGRRNPFKQEIADKEDFEAEAKEEKKKKKKKDKKAQKKEKAKEKAKRGSEKEKDDLDAVAKERRSEEGEEEKKEAPRFNREGMRIKEREKREERERERVSKREDYLRKEGIDVSKNGSPGEILAKDHAVLLAKDYRKKVYPVEDRLLREDGKHFSFLVEDDRDSYKGLVASEDEAEREMDFWISARMAERISNLKEKQEQFLQRETYEKQKEAKMQILGGLPVENWRLIDGEKKTSLAKEIFDPQTTNLQVERLSRVFAIITYKKDGQWHLVASQNRAMVLQRTNNNELVTVRQDQWGHHLDQTVSTLTPKKSEEDLEEQAKHIAEAKHGRASRLEGLPSFSKGKREEKERQAALRQRATRDALDELKSKEDDFLRQEMLDQAKEYMKKLAAKYELRRVS